MSNVISGAFNVFGFSLLLAGNLLAQGAQDDPQGRTLAGLKNFAVHAQVQFSAGTTLPPIDQDGLRGKMEQGIRQEGMEILRGNDVRDGPRGPPNLLLLSVENPGPARPEDGVAPLS